MTKNKRRAGSTGEAPPSSKKVKVKKQWRTPKKGIDGEAVPQPQNSKIEPGDTGFWVTCDMGKEARCVAEVRDLFGEYADRLHPKADTSEPGNGGGIEADIETELESMRKPENEPLFTHVRLDVPCVLFFKTASSFDPVSAVHAICTEASTSTERKRGRFVKRLIPMTLMGKATEGGLEKVAQQVLAPHFHEPSCGSKKFAIRPSFRMHNVLTRDLVIRKVAAMVGPNHKVDLKDYDALILIELYKNVCGMSVVGSDYDKLKRYNLAEIYEPVNS